MKRSRLRGAVEPGREERQRRVRLAAPETWRVERVVPGGDGFCRIEDGRAAFVPGGLPGDVFNVSWVEDHGRFLRAAGHDLIAPSEARVEPPCRHAAECGGCDWMALGRAAQLEHKRALVIEALRRTGHIQGALVDPVVTAGGALGYRGRIRLHVSEGRVGFFGAGSHDLCEIDQCLVADARLQPVIDALRRGPASLLDGLESVSARVTPDGAVVARAVAARGRALDEERRAALADLGASAGFVLEAADDPAPAEQRFPVADAVTLTVRGGTFSQVNWSVNQEIVRRLVARTRELEVSRFLDLYAGAGNFALPLCAAGLGGVAVEMDADAVATARRSLAPTGRRSLRFVVGEAARAAARLARAREAFDLVVLDPPRSGARSVLPSVLALAPAHVAYVSCDPVTFARDARVLCDGGYRLERVTPFDMFPQTHHVEVLGWLARGAVGPETGRERAS